MFLIDQFSFRERKTGRRSPSSGLFQALAVIIIAFVAVTTGSPEKAHAQVGVTDQFTPSSWQPGAEPAREASRSRSSRRNARVTVTTELEEFDVPQRKARTSARSRTGYTTRVVERKRSPRRVRVASLGNVGVSMAAPRKAVKRRAQATRVAALGPTAPSVPSVTAPARSLTGGGIAWKASAGCLAGNLRSLVASLATSHGSVTVNSTCRSARHNRRVGGARKSWHLTGNAVDFRVHGANVSRVYAFLRGNVGGIKHYGGGRFHIDNGPKRSF